MTRSGFGARTHRRVRVALALCVVAAGCAARASVPPTSPFYGTSLTPYDALVRHHLLTPTPAGVKELRSADTDEVVRLMNEGLLLHRLDRFAESNAALQRAEAIATARYTRSLVQDIASFVVSDNAVDYQASAQERSMIHYYGMLNFLALGDTEGALVEARKANALLRRYANDFPNRSFVNDAAVQYLVGMLQWGLGEENDAMVSLRQSLAGYETYQAHYGVRTPELVAIDVARVADAVGFDEVAVRTRENFLGGSERDAEVPARDRDSGDVVLVIENGFVAHKRQEKLFVPVLREERDSVLSGSAGSAVEAAFRVLVRTVIVMTEMSREGQNYVQAHEDGVTFVSGALSAAGVELITMAWPRYDLDARRATSIRVSAPDGIEATPVVMEDLSAIAVRDFEERKTSMLLRMTARTLMKEAGVIQSERAGEAAGGALGGFAARVAARTLANATERADTRSWSGLPAELLLTRLRLPAGRHDLVVTFEGPSGTETRTVPVDVRAGSVTLRSVAVVGRDPGDRGRFQRAQRDIEYKVSRPAVARRGTGR